MMTKTTPQKARRPIGPTVDDLVRGYQREIERRADELERVRRREAQEVAHRDLTISQLRMREDRLSREHEVLRHQLTVSRKREAKLRQSIARLEQQRDELLGKLHAGRSEDRRTPRRWRRRKNALERRVVQVVEIPESATDRQIYEAVVAVMRDRAGGLPEDVTIEDIGGNAVRATTWQGVLDINRYDIPAPRDTRTTH
jgi:chromosome segregation ATPase